jgi:hypothetical protein
MLMQGIHEEEVILADALVKVGVVDVGGESVVPHFIGSCGGGFCDLGMDGGRGKEKCRFGDGTRTGPDIYLVTEQEHAHVDAWAWRMKRRQFHYFAHAPRSLRRPR